METRYIYRLLELYFQGKTSLIEEAELRSFFLNHESLPDDLARMRPLFTFFNELTPESSDSSGIESKLDRLISQKQAEGLPKQARTISIARWAQVAAIVAIVLLAVGYFAFLRHPVENDTFSDPHLAYREAEKTLVYISEQLNKGMKPLSQVSKINSGNNQLQNLRKLDEGLGMLNRISFINNTSNLKK